MYYIVGLGNPGEEYVLTRHNVGFLALDNFITSVGLPKSVHRAWCSGSVTEGVVAKAEVIVLYPETYMNNSGVSIKKLLNQEGEGELVVVYDDVALPLGQVKVSFGRGDGGHNGIKSVINSLGTKDFIRVRIGVAPKTPETSQAELISGNDRVEFVLGRFGKREQKQLETDVLPLVSKVLATIVEAGYVKAMNEFN